MNQNYKIGNAIGSAWRFSITNWRLLLLLYCVNVIFSLVIISPFNDALGSSLDKRLAPDRISFTFISDLFSNQSFSIDSQFTLLFIGGVFYLLWLIFATAGVTNYVRSNASTLSDFWSGASSNFWKFLRLTFYMLINMSAILLIAFQLFNIGETNIFSIESEEMFITRAVIILPLIALFYTLAKLWNDTLKVSITSSPTKTWFFDLGLKTWKRIFNKRLILTFVINILITLLILAVLISIKNASSHYLLIFCISQIMLLVRLMYKVANLKTISDLVE